MSRKLTWRNILDGFDFSINDGFSDLLGPKGFAELRNIADPTFMEDASNHIYAEFEVPGAVNKDLSVLVEGRYLTITGSWKLSGVQKKLSVNATIPDTANAETVRAKLRNGVLAVIFDKIAPEKTAVRVNIDVA